MSRIREYDRARDAAGLRACFVELQEYERVLDPELLPAEQIVELAHTYGITKPAALVWGMHGTGHHYNGYLASIIGTTLNVITGNFDAPGGVIDTELTKSDKGGKATGKDFLKR